MQCCRVKVTKNGFAGQSLGDQPTLLLLRGKSGRSESPAADVADAVNALMQAVHFPAAASITSQVILHRLLLIYCSLCQLEVVL